MASVASTGFYTWQIEPHWVRLVDRPMPIKGLLAELDGKLLVQVSDLHVGRVVDFDYLVESIQWVSNLQPDIVAVTGDFMTCRGFEQVRVAKRFSHLRAPPLGAFSVLGNHDYGAGFRRHEVAAKLASRLDEAGVRLLRNEVATIGGLQVLGVEDYWGPAFDLDAAVALVDPDQPMLALRHNPDVADLPAWKSARGWMLCGHTHGGQCKPPFLPPPILPVRNRRYTSGEFDLGDGRWMYINPGLGYLHRVRFNVRPEITRFRLTSA